MEANVFQMLDVFSGSKMDHEGLFLLLRKNRSFINAVDFERCSLNGNMPDSTERAGVAVELRQPVSFRWRTRESERKEKGKKKKEDSRLDHHIHNINENNIGAGGSVGSVRLPSRGNK